MAWLVTLGAPAILSGIALWLGWRLWRCRHDAAVLAASHERLSLAAEATADGLWDIDLMTRAVHLSPRWREMLGYTATELPATRAAWEALIHPADLPLARQLLKRHLTDGGPFRLEYRLRHKDGEWRWLLNRGRAVRSAQGRAVRMVGTHTDITTDKRLTADLAERTRELEVLRKRLADAQRIAHVGSWEWDLAGERLWWSDEVSAVLGLTATTAPALEQIVSRVPGEDRMALEQALHRARSGDGPLSIDHRLVRDDGTPLVVHQEGQVTTDATGRPLRMRGTLQDVTELRRQELQTRQLSMAVDHAPIAIVITERDGTIVYANPALSGLTGYGVDEVIGKTPRIFSAGRQPASVYRELWDTILAGGTWQGEIVNRRKDGGLYWEDLTIAPVRDHAGVIARFVCLKRDVTERKARQEHMENLAYYDPLVGLPNRALFQQRLDTLEALCGRTGQLVAVLYLDLDGFKQVNDLYGHEAGDHVLKVAAQRLRGVLRQTDMAARLGGDEFAVTLLLGDAERHLATVVADRIIQSLRQPIAWRDNALGIGTSIGVAFYPCAGRALDRTVQAADHAMYLAKRGGKNRYVVDDG